MNLTFAFSNCQVIYHIAEDVPPLIVADPTRLRQIVTNLVRFVWSKIAITFRSPAVLIVAVCSNACKFTENQGQVVEISVTRCLPALSGGATDSVLPEKDDLVGTVKPCQLL